MKTKSLFISLFLSITLLLHAQLKIASVLDNNMVLQRNTEVKIWGTSNPNSKLTISVDWNKSKKINTVSNDKGQWLVKVKTTEAGGPYQIHVSDSKQSITLNNILLGEVWLCSGQSNMEMPMIGFNDSPINGSNDILMDAENNNIRLFTVKKAAFSTPQDTCSGNWTMATAENAGKFSAVGYLFARQLQRKLNVPVGMICSSWGGSRIESWIKKDYMSNSPELQKLTVNNKTALLYNGMIHPIKNFVIKGAIWYQGEANRSDFQYYAGLMGGLVENWRNAFDVNQFPFYFVQIAPFRYNNSKDILSGKFCDEQLKASLAIPNCGMVSTIDLGEEKNIHPAEKTVVAKRLVCWAISETYGIKGITYKPPYFKTAVVKDSTMLVSFENAALGLSSYGKELTNFEVAGEDKIFYPAKAGITSKQVKVFATEVKKPIAVRYSFCNFPQGNGFLYNSSGLPVLSFRSDDW